MSQSQDSGASRPFCRGPNCSFYGDAVTGYCSVCAKKNNVTAAEPKKDAAPAIVKPPSSAPVPIKGAAASQADDGVSTVSPSSASVGSLGTSPDKGGLPTRCASCNKKLGLTGIRCRCDQYFCSNHRYSDQHNCTFDYKSKGRDELSKANPVIISPKVDKI